MVYYSATVYYAHVASRNCVIIAPKWGVPDGNHMNDDIAEVKGSLPPMFQGSFLHKKEPG